MAIQIEAPFDMFNGLDGKPLTNGKVYIGQVGTDPTVIANQIPVFWDEGLTIPAAQPLVTNAGYIVRFGTPARVYAATDYSISVRNSSNILVYYLAEFGAVDYASDADLAALSGALQLADYAALRSYTGSRNAVYVAGAGIAGWFRKVISGTDNGATTIVASNGIIWTRVYSGGVDIRWWGAKFDNIADDTAAVQACIDYAVPLQILIQCPVGSSKITQQIVVPFTIAGMNMVGQGYQYTKFVYPTLTLGQSLFRCIGYPGALSGGNIYGIGFNGNSGTTAFTLVGVTGQIIERCQFGANAFACVLENSSAGSFTEFNILRDCDFLLGCSSALWYLQMTGGDASFHGSGIEGGTINNSGVNSVLVLSPNANPYNAPFSPTIFVHANVTIISHLAPSGAFRPNFYGNLKLEVQQGRALLCDAPAINSIAYAGKIMSQSTNVEFGSLILCDGVFSAQNGTRQTIGARVSRRQDLITGNNPLPPIPYNIMDSCVTIAIRVVGPNYDYRSVYQSWGSDLGGTIPQIAALTQYNVAGYGPPVVTLDSQTRINISNANYPASGVVAMIDIQQVGQSPGSVFIP